jgi:hypothetical protein
MDGDSYLARGIPSYPQFSMVALFRYRLHRFLLHWASASLHRPQGALGSASVITKLVMAK